MTVLFENLLKTASLIITEGAIVERLKREFCITLDEHINNAALVYAADEKMGMIYRQYIEIAKKYSLPIMLTTPTRKVTAESLKKSIYHEREVIADCCRYLKDIRAGYKGFSEQIYVGGLLGCKGNAYNADHALPADEAYQFHKQQVDQVREQELDFLQAAIMPAFSEAQGMARAMSGADLPYIISFMVRKDGCLLDGTYISEAIAGIDKTVTPQPICYMANCIHPSSLKKALSHPKNRNSAEIKRFMGIQANASLLNPETLDQNKTLHQDDPKELILETCNLRKEFNLKIVGGCCGTDDHFLDGLAQACLGKEVEIGNG